MMKVVPVAIMRAELGSRDQVSLKHREGLPLSAADDFPYGLGVVHGTTVTTEEIAAYAPVALAGLGWLPDAILSRSIVIRMRRRHAGEHVEQFRRRLHVGEGNGVRLLTEKWAASIEEVAWPDLPPEITDRTADSWESLVAIADLAAGDWPKKARDAAVALVAEAKEREPSLGVWLLADLRTVFGERDAMASKAILVALQALSEAPWNEVPGKQGKGKPLDERGLAFRLKQYGIKPKTVRISEATPRGYERAALQEAWARFLPPALPDSSKTSKTSETGRENKDENVADDVSDAQHDPQHENPTEYGAIAYVADVLDAPGNGGESLGIPGLLDRRRQPEKTNFFPHSYMSEDDERFVAGSDFK